MSYIIVYLPTVTILRHFRETENFILYDVKDIFKSEQEARNVITDDRILYYKVYNLNAIGYIEPNSHKGNLALIPQYLLDVIEVE